MCSVNNGGCSQNCLEGQGGTAVCYCKKGYRLGPDQLTCEGVYFMCVCVLRGGGDEWSVSGYQ